ncbi:hypothetical protein GIB67_008264 [Kingdonia uniflora]|uniref:Uncharacterized protein n=1 Tax=Kingdonia uniflora TaxID=39325 RepID=A0A7J7N4R9_9MAGN|nr:hypothetical protein GIB67_008264 [Kingdonia uniflora]
MAEERDRRDNRTRYTKNLYEGKRKDVPVRSDDMDTCPEEPSFQKLRDNIKAFLPSSLKPQSVADRGRNISKVRKFSNFERSPPVLCDPNKKDKVLSSEMCSKNPKPSSKFVVSASSVESSSSERTMDDSVVISTVTADNSFVSSGRDVGLHAGDETGQSFKYPKNVDVAKKFLQYKKSLDREWGNYVMNTGLWFRTLVRPSETNPKVVADTSSLFDVVSREGSELNKVLGELGICREKRLNSVVEKIQQAHQKRAMATFGSAYADVMEITACIVGTSSSLVQRPRMKKTVPPSEQIAPVQIPPVRIEGVVADVNMVPPLKKQKKESGKDIRASSKGVNLEAVEQEALDLATRDLIRLDTQNRSNISQLFIAWKLATEVLKLATANRGELVRQHDAEKVVPQEQFEQEKVLQREQFKKEKVLQREQFEKEVAATKQEVEDEAKKAVDIAVASRNKLIQAFYFWGLSREDVDLALAGKYGEIIFPGDDASPVAEQTPAPPVTDDLTKKGKRAIRILFSNIKKEDRKIYAQLEIDLRHACDELEWCKGHNACLEREKVEYVRLLQNSEKRVTLLEARLLDTQQRLQVSQSRLKKKITPKRGKRATDTEHECQMADVIGFYGGELERVKNEFRHYISSCGKDVEVENDKVENMWFAKRDEGGGASTSKPRAEESEEEEGAMINYSREVDNKLHRLKHEMERSVQITNQYRGSLLQEKKSLEARCKDLDDELNKVKTKFYEATLLIAENVTLRVMAMLHGDVEKF